MANGVNTIKAGDIIEAPYWQEQVHVKFVNPVGEYIQIIGQLTKSGQHIDQMIPINEISQIKIISSNGNVFSEAWKVFLAIETIRYRYASVYDPLLAVNISKVDPLPHQIEAVYGYILKYPQIRFLLADDPGAGKTIMAGLIIKELKLRYVVKRVLIVCPGHLIDQWKRELKERFDENFEFIDRNKHDGAYKFNIWDSINQVITSIDFAKKDDVRKTLAASYFDLIIVDEAHKMSAHRYGEKVYKSERYKLGEVLSSISNHLLFLTATPHKGDPENFRLFIDLLKPGFFASNDIIKQSIENRDNPLFLRRIKEDLYDFEGKPLFLPRHVNTVTFDLGISSPQEKELYNELSKYVERQYNLAISKDSKRNIAFALVILQRRLASSTYALLKSLERRKARLEELYNNSLTKNINERFYEIEDFDDIEDMSEDERWEKEKDWESITVAENREELKKEIATIDELINKALNIITSEGEIKLKKLKESLDELSNKVPEPQKRKILIFTESRDTLEYLEGKLRNWGYSVNTIHGGMKLEERVKAESTFKNETEVLIATEAAGEGINLQFCNLMINYDIPWNPNRLEQRMGRIHRYGQTREVFIHNLVASDTREGRVLKRMFEKLEEIKSVLGTDKVFDIIGEIIDSRQFIQAISEAAVNAKTIDEILQSIEIRIDEDYITKVKENLGQTLATHFIDYTRIKELSQKAKEQRLIPEYTFNYFRKAFEKAGGKIKILEPGFVAIDLIPHEIKKIAGEEAFKKIYGTIEHKYPKATFDKEIAVKNPHAEFISFGHPLFEAVLQWVEKEFYKSFVAGAKFYDPDNNLDGYILFFEGQIKDGTGNIAGKRLFSFYVNDDIIKPISPFILWDLIEENSPEEYKIDISGLITKTTPEVLLKLKEYKSELQQERNRQAEIKLKYGVKSLEYFIWKLDDELIDLESRKQSGENVDLAIYNKEDRKKTYEKELKELKLRIEQEKTLIMDTPRYVGWVLVKPYTGALKQIISSDNRDKIEKIGMDIAMMFERNQGRNPEDVSAQNLGFDIRSTDSLGNIRYIEVKARSGKEAVSLTQNEWFKAHRFANDYYLYVVLNADTSPELYIIQNPAETIKPEQNFEVRYFVTPDSIMQKGHKATTI